MVSVRAMCFMLVLGFVSISVFSEVGLGLVSFLISFCLGLRVLGTLKQFGRRIPLVNGFWSWGFAGLGGVQQLVVCIVL